MKRALFIISLLNFFAQTAFSQFQLESRPFYSSIEGSNLDLHRLLVASPAALRLKIDPPHISYNNGQTWSIDPVLYPNKPQAFNFFQPKGNILYGTDYDLVYRSMDDGITWTTHTNNGLGLHHVINDSSLISRSAISSGDIKYSISRNYGNTYVPLDTGQLLTVGNQKAWIFTFEEPYMAPGPDTIYTTCRDLMTGAIVSEYVSTIPTTYINGGLLNLVHTNDSIIIITYYGKERPGCTDTYIVSYAGTLLSRDGGATWSVDSTEVISINTKTDSAIFRVRPNVVEYSLDEAVSWQNLPIPASWAGNLLDVDMQNGYIFVIRSDRKMFRSANWGLSWEDAYDGISNDMGKFYGFYTLPNNPNLCSPYQDAFLSAYGDKRIDGMQMRINGVWQEYKPNWFADFDSLGAAVIWKGKKVSVGDVTLLTVDVGQQCSTGISKRVIISIDSLGTCYRILENSFVVDAFEHDSTVVLIAQEDSGSGNTKSYHISNDGGRTFTDVSTTLPFPYVKDVVSMGPKMLYIKSGRLARRDSIFGTDTLINVIPYQVVSFLRLAADSNKLFFGVSHYNTPSTYLLTSVDTGQTWSSVSLGSYSAGHVLDIKAHEGNIFVSFNPSGTSLDSFTLFMSPDRGNTWKDITGNLISYSSVPSQVGAYGGQLDIRLGKLFVTTNYGVFSADIDVLNCYANPQTAGCGIVSGFVFNDANRNCTASPNEDDLENMMVVLQPGNYYTTTNSQGQFSFNVPHGTYQVSVDLQGGLAYSCGGVQSATVNSLNNIVDSIGFPIYVADSLPDVKTTIATGPVRPQMTSFGAIEYCNLGFSMLNAGSIKLQLPDDFIFDSAIPSPDTITADYLTWNYASLQIQECRHIQFTLRNSLQWTDVGEMISFESCALLNVVESDSANNCDIWQMEVTSSYDPNDKLVKPWSSASNFSLPNVDTTLTYTIRFQNTGTDTAFNIAVVDTLPSALDITTFEALGASHPYEYEILPGNVVKWHFNNILLPDSNVNEPLSHGFAKFGIRTTGIGHQSVISNKAEIYFDFNPAVVTPSIVLQFLDSTLLTIRDLSPSAHFKLYPNPTENSTIVQPYGDGIYSYTVINSMGSEIIGATEVLGSSIIELANFSSGVYYVKFTWANGSETKALVKY